MHLEATAVLLGLQDLGGKLTTGSHLGVILGPSLALLWAMLKLSRAMVGHAEGICQMLFGHVVGFVFQSALSSGFWQAMLDPCQGQMQGSKQHCGPRLGPSLAILGPFQLQLCFLRQSWGILRASWAIGRSC